MAHALPLFPPLAMSHMSQAWQACTHCTPKKACVTTCLSVHLACKQRGVSMDEKSSVDV